MKKILLNLFSWFATFCFAGDSSILDGVLFGQININLTRPFVQDRGLGGKLQCMLGFKVQLIVSAEPWWWM